MKQGAEPISVWIAKIDKLCQLPLDAYLQNQEPSKLTPAFIAGRQLLMHFFGSHCLNFLSYSEQGKPYFTHTNLPKFNLSHSENWIALAFCSHHDVGIDIESIRPRKQRKNIIECYFNQQEQARLNELDEHHELPFFWQYWTAHEAVIKQKGHTVWQMEPRDTLADELAARKLQLTCWKTSQWCLSLCFPVGLIAQLYFLSSDKR